MIALKNIFEIFQEGFFPSLKIDWEGLCSYDKHGRDFVKKKVRGILSTLSDRWGGIMTILQNT